LDEFGFVAEVVEDIARVGALHPEDAKEGLLADVVEEFVV
jgi:hypothetical protein